MSAGGGFTLLQLDRGDHDPMILARALAAVRGSPVQDQVIEAKRAWGIVAEELAEHEAKALGNALRASGVECAVGRSAAVVEPPPAELISTVAEVPAEEPILIAVAGIEVTTSTTKTEEQGRSTGQKMASAAIMMTTGLPIKVGKKKKKVETTQEERSLLFVADLHYRAPRRRLRIDASHFDFSCLGERMVYQGQQNLKRLVQDFVDETPGAWTNHGTRVLLEGRPIRTMGYQSIEDLNREARWLLTLAAVGL